MGIVSKLFGRRSGGAGATMTSQRAVEVINEFGSVLDRGKPAPGCVADLTKLPFPKEQIRQALIIGLRSNPDPKMKQMLRMAYIELANWQPGVGVEDQGLDTSKLNLAEDVEGLARDVLGQMQRQDEWSAIVLQEQSSAKSELERLGLC
jgi:hypothetical protein